MKLEFCALWIDDQPKHVKSFAEGIQRRLSELGFELEVSEATALDKVEQVLGGHVHNDGIDLVLVDYDLGVKGAGGEQALASVRKRFPHKDIIFYSADDREKLREIAYKSKIDGVYFSTRLSLVDDTISIIEKTLSKVLDIDHMRGIVMAATSDIDDLVERSLIAVHKRLGEQDQEAFRRETVAAIEKKLSKWGEDLAKADGKSKLDAILKLKHLFTAADRLDYLLRQLDDWKNNNSTPLETASIYRSDIVPRRNKLAHARLIIQDKRRVLLGDEGPISDEDMRELRCELIRHRGNFTEIAVLVDAQLD
ncbi:MULTISPECIES: response regulator [Agrobacterium]|uniref:response regulator n=1 Tax=Agrobacterium TaxID=357 RepID=UPI002300ADB9|nr:MULTISPECIES: response regulator [Agrobacterium]MDA5637880.1 response regulator [Agrobacterium sp. ST15.13.013]MDA6997447.1 response regulator [Agrobacterium salinitolerans]